MRLSNTGKILARILIGAILVISASANAMEQQITQALIIKGSDGPQVLTPYQLPSAENTEYTLHEIDYDELKRQISIYKTIYLTGQIIHGGIILKFKPKFVD